ncbi:lysylphosphatidylglycerol synthase transmembrane domain-containing protein [Neorhizobium galegae]|uniref:Putative integral membrane protein n=1 Tax=Neorhizobium galegae bv. officinalis TaxID=323656 RepID=A0A0T7GVC5_NEOGA|nr:lysylphosphatidylglycerol synthase transmembrane domain-containing protein [Neorhizobium galegae]CDZ51229.1 Putative integral membrane protein [Neorhizobium galegae bv. officinalis]
MRFLKLIGLSAAFVLLIAVILRFDPQRIAASLASADPTYISAGLILVQVQIVLSALRWRFTAARLGQHMGIGKAIGDYYLGTLLNQLLPGGVAGDAVRAVRNRANGDGGWKVPAQAVLFERVAGQGVFFVIATFGVMLWPLLGRTAIPEDLRHLLSGFALVAAGLAIVFLLLLRLPPRRVQPLLAALKAALAQVFLRDRAWIVQTLFSLVIVASYIAVFMLASAAVGAPLPALAAVTAIPLCLLMMLIPATIAGWGAREAAAAALWPLFGYAASDGVAASILYGILALAGAAPGLAFILAALFSRRNR